MRVLLLTQYYPPEVGAAPVRLQAMVRELTARGHEVEVVTALPNYPYGRIFDGYRRTLFRTEQRDGATVRRVWVHAATGSGLGRVLALVTFSLTATLGMFRSRRPDVVLVESPPLTAAVPGLIHRMVRRRPNVLLLADLWPDTAVELGMLGADSFVFRAMARLESLVYRTTERISPVTDGQVETLISDKGVPPEKIAFLPNGVDTRLFRPTEYDLTSPSTVLFAGNLGYAQGIDVILDAAPIVHRTHPHVKFLFVGGGSELQRLQDRVRDEAIEGIEFREPVPVDEVAPLFRQSMAGITSLKSSKLLEGARPSKIFPIMASGRPVLYSGNGEGARLVSDIGAGLVAPAEDSIALAAAVTRLADDPNAADEMGRNGRRFVEEHLSWNTLIDRWLEDLGDPREFG